MNQNPDDPTRAPGGKPQPSAEEFAEQFSDPIARRTGWTRVHGGGASFRARTLREDSAGRIRVVNTLRAMLLPTGFGLAAVAIVCLACYDLFIALTSDPERLSFPAFVMLLLLAAFLCLPAFFTFRARDRLTFDRASGRFWTGTEPAADGGPSAARPLDRIAGLQILPKYVRGSGSSARRGYWSYELNLILDDHERVLVTDHGDLEATRRDAELLRRLLDVPVFEARL